MKSIFTLQSLLCLLMLTLSMNSVGQTEESPPTTDNPNQKFVQEQAIFAGGCFWCMQEAYANVPGVISTEVGYSGGNEPNPTYEQVSSGLTGHAEVIRVTFDPRKISYEGLVRLFWMNTDPSVPNRQFCDVGRQYRSAIFATTDEQLRIANIYKEALIKTKRFDKVYTEVEKAGPFYRAEEYHQMYFEKRPLRYKFYKYQCGRKNRLIEIWSNK